MPYASVCARNVTKSEETKDEHVSPANKRTRWKKRARLYRKRPSLDDKFSNTRQQQHELESNKPVQRGQLGKKDTSLTSGISKSHHPL
jgi:hypothetical protein